MERVIVLVCFIFLIATGKVYSVEPNLELGQAPINTQIVAADEKLKDSLEEVIEKLQIITKNSSQIKILDLKWEEDTLIINLSKDILNYGGGNTTEFIVSQSILDWAFTNTKAQAVTLLIDGGDEALPEGTEFSYYTRENYLRNADLRKEIYEENNICNDK